MVAPRAIASPVIERLTGAGDFSDWPGQTRLDGAGCRGGGGGRGIQRLSVARHLRLARHHLDRRWCRERHQAVQPQTGNPRGLWRSRNRGNDQLSGRGCHTSQVLDTTLPWSYTITTTLPAVFANVVAQGDSNSIGCRITVNGVVKDERIVNEVRAYTFCLDKSS